MEIVLVTYCLVARCETRWLPSFYSQTQRLVLQVRLFDGASKLIINSSMGLAASRFYKWFKFFKKKSQSQCALSFTKLYTRDEASSSIKRLSLKNRPGPLSHTHLLNVGFLTSHQVASKKLLGSELGRSNFHAGLPISMVLGQMFGGWDTFSQKVFLKTKVVLSHKRGSSGSERCFFTFRQRALFKTQTITLLQVFFPSASCSLFERSGRLVKPLVIHPYSFGMSRHAIWRKRLNS